MAKSSENSVNSPVKKIVINGPVSSENGASVLRFNRDGRRKPIDLMVGQVLNVGEGQDITEDEAKRLMSYAGWSIKEVTE